MNDRNGWTTLTEANPGHSQWYIDRFKAMAEQGVDLAGEARLVDAMLPRRATVLDAGCGTGRVGGHLANAGHRVVGVDIDPSLVAAARTDHPTSRWFVGDLAELDLPAQGIETMFDAIVCAGNVITFVAPGTRRTVLSRMRTHLSDTGRLIVGFGAGRGYEFAEFLNDTTEVGLTTDLLLSTWDLRPFHDGSDFLVAVLR